MAGRQGQSETEEFTERGIMSLVVLATELKEVVEQFGAVIMALATTHNISTDV